MPAPERIHCRINRLPAEILSKVFLHACDTSTLSHRPKSYVQLIPLYIQPIDISHVCQFWRNVALANGRLWTFIVVSDGHRYYLDRLDAFVERSKQSPLHILISWTPTWNQPKPDDIDWKFFCQMSDHLVGKILKKLIISGGRWKSFELAVETPWLMSRILGVLDKVTSPLLTDVTLHTTLYDGEDVDEWDPSLANNSGVASCFPFPLCDLRTVSFDATAPNWSQDSPYQNLQSLKLYDIAEETAPSVPAFRRFLTASPALEVIVLRDFRFNFLIHNPVIDYDGPVVELPLLRHLSISGLRPQDDQALFSHLRIPNVEIMDLDCDGKYGTLWDFTVSGLSTTYPDGSSMLESIQALRIGRLRRQPSLLPSFFGRLISLRVLVVEYFPGGWDEFLLPLQRYSEALAASALEDHQSNVTHLPFFTTLVCPGIAAEELMGFMTARKRAGIPLRHVFVTNDTAFSDSDKARISKEVELFGELSSSVGGHADISLEDLLDVHRSAEGNGGRFRISC